MNQSSGIRELDSVERYSKYAVLPQNPWLLNGSGKVELSLLYFLFSFAIEMF